jgi:hypothetical protein
MITKDGFQIRHSGNVVTVTKAIKNGDDFDSQLEGARGVLHCFKQSGGSEWGCDGVGYGIQKRAGIVLINRSGVSSSAFLKGCAEVRARVLR